jgi:hypothetical protein
LISIYHAVLDGFLALIRFYAAGVRVAVFFLAQAKPNLPVEENGV